MIANVHHRRLAAGLVCLLAAATLRAQDAEKLALSQLKSAAQPEIKAAKAALAGHKQDLFDSLHLIEVSLASAEPHAAAVALAGALDAFQVAVHRTVDDATAAIRAAAQAKLQELALLGPLNGQLPEGFLNGDGGALDKLLAQVDAPLDALYASVDKRLNKLEAKAEGLGLGLLAWAGRPDPAQRGCVTDLAEVLVSTPLRIDVLVSASRLDVEMDGVIVCGGRARVGSTHVDVSCVAADGQLYANHAPLSVTDPESARFQGVIDLDGFGLPENNYGVYAKEDNDGSETTVFGLR